MTEANFLLKRQQFVFDAIKDVPILEELAVEPTARFEISTGEEVLWPIIDNNDIVIVAGSYFGDEGKGKITDAIANHPAIEIIARTNSGENAGHTVVNDGVKYVFHLTPSGIMVPGKICVIGPECVMDPVNFFNKEVQNLIDADTDYQERLFIGNVHIVGPHHKIMDFALSANNSSTLMGMAYVHASKVRKRGLRLDDLFNDRSAAVEKFGKDLETYEALLRRRGITEETILSDLEHFVEETGRKVPDHLFEFLEARDKAGYVLDLYEKTVVNNPAFPQRRDVVHMIRSALREGKKVLGESPQSYWLSNATEKHWGSSTSAQTHASGVLASMGVNPTRYNVAVVNVAKTPADSRVGIGANPSSFVPQDYFSRTKEVSRLDDLGDACIDFDAIQKMYFDAVQDNGILQPVEWTDETGTYSISEAMAISAARHFGERGATTNKPRVTGIYDCVAGRQVNDAQGPYLSISAMDRGDDMDKVGMTVAYVYHNIDGEQATSNGVTYSNGDIIKVGDAYPCDNVLKHCHPVIRIVPGWKDTPIAAGNINPGDSLPENVERFVGLVEEYTGFEVIAIGNGPDTDNLLYLRREKD